MEPTNFTSIIIIIEIKRKRKKKDFNGLGPLEGNKRDLEIPKNTHRKTTEEERLPEKKNKGLVPVVVTGV